MMLPTLAGILLAAALAATPSGGGERQPSGGGVPMDAVEKVPASTETVVVPAEPAAEERKPAGRLGAARKSLKLIVYGPQGGVLDLERFLSFIGRADRREGADQKLSGIFVFPPGDPASAQRPALEQKGDLIVLSWEKLSAAALSLPWPVAEDGFSSVWADKGGAGYSDGDAVFLNEELAITQYRLFKESLRKRTSDWSPIYKPGAKARKTAEGAQALMAAAHAEKGGAARARAFDAALTAVSLAWQKMLFEHGLQTALGSKRKAGLRFGLTIDESIFKRLDHYESIISAIKRSGANWVRLVFRSNPDDFTYASMRSFTEYDSLVAELRGQDPCFWAVRRGLRRSGLTIHRMDEQFDRGPVLAAAAFEVEDDDCGGSVYLKALGLVPGLLALVLEAFEGEDRPGLLEVEQPGEGSTAPRITSQRLRLHPELTVASALRLVRAANPFYGAWTVVQGRLLKVWQARAYLGPEEVPERMPGVALLNGTFLLKCRNGWIAPEIVQHAQYQVLDAELYCRKYVEKA